MLKKLMRVFMLLVFLIPLLFAPAGMPGTGVVEAKIPKVRPAGRWITECSLLRRVQVTWTSEVKLGDTVFVVEAEFTKGSSQINKRVLPKKGISGEGQLVLAFKLMPEQDTIWLGIMSDGSLDPAMTGFDQSVAAQNYPGGYQGLVEDLMSMGVSWPDLYSELKGSAAEILKSIDADFCEVPQKKESWPRLLTG